MIKSHNEATRLNVMIYTFAENDVVLISNVKSDVHTYYSVYFNKAK